jgi:general L-amino acid transport system permease protein
MWSQIYLGGDQMVDTAKRHETVPKTSFINNPTFRNAFYQVVVAGLILVAGYSIVQNTLANLARQSISTGFDFFWATSGFDIFFTLIPYDRASQYWDAFVVGLLNTLLVSFIGIVLSTLLGFFIGISRLSSNWLVARLATVYVETIRNIPLLLQLFFWYLGVLKALPLVKQSLTYMDVIFINRRGAYVPAPMPDEKFVWVVAAVIIAIISIIALRFWALHRLKQTGKRFPVLWTSIGVLVLLPTIVWFASGTQMAFDMPELKGFNFKGGMTLPPEFLALLLGLTLYTAAFIGETVRAGILAVNHGQTEAAKSLGLREGDVLRLVVVPQAMRVIVPPLTSQYLNLTKNSSLAVAIGYPDLVSVFMKTTLNQTGRAVEVVFITMMVYLTLSLATSALMNWYNSRVTLTER